VSRVVEMRPYAVEPLIHRASIYRMTNELKRAIRDLEQIVELQPKNGVFHLNLGQAWLEIGDQEKAVSCFTAAIRWNVPEKQVLTSVLNYGENLAGRSPDHPAKRVDWYKNSVQSLRPFVSSEPVRRQLDDVLQLKVPDVKMLGDELGQRIRLMIK